MNKLIFSTALVLSLGLAGCGEEKAKEEPQKENGTKTEEQQRVQAKTTDDVIKHFFMPLTEWMNIPPLLYN